ncbi:MAG: histidine kinase [Candidatus Riflebacteria bacterium HGW-Riflebacteria-1]|jgi:PAS domain S-box-containing protein|nr:MAG: histidine kinase [Candidatus Riflebacteria bacterium HGW-Riflebacteria-1]
MTDKSVFADILNDQELLRSLVGKSVDGLMVIDQNGMIIYANPSAIDMFIERMPVLVGSNFGIPAINEAVELILPCRAEKRHVEMRSSEFLWGGRAVYLASLRDITLRRQLFDSLQQREKMLQNIFDILPVGLWFADADGRLERGNKAGVAIWGAEPKVGIENYGVFKARRLPSGEEIAADDWALAQAVRNKTTTLDEMLEIECFDGSKKIILNYAAPVLDENGNVQGAVVVNNDITERMKTEEALRESELHFRTLANSGQALVWTSGLDKNCNYFNQVWLDFTGRTIEQELGTGWTEGVHPDDLQECVDTYCQAFDRREKFSMVYRVRRHDGEYRWIQDDGSPRFNRHGDFIGFIGHCLDVSERINYEQRIAESERLFRSLIESAPDAILVQSSSRHVFANDAAVTLFSASSQDQLLATPVMDLIPPERRSIAQARIEKLLNDKLPISTFETIRLRLDKSAVHVEISAVPIKFAGKDSALSFIRNIEERVIARTERENLMTQLAQAQKMESIGALAGGVAHDFNNMLQVILGETEFAIDENQAGPLNSQLAASLIEIKKAAVKSAELTRQLLTFARRQLYRPEVLDINEVIDGMLKMLRRMIGENIDLLWKPGHAVWRIEMDPSQLDQVLANLAVNARDAIDNVGTLVIETSNIVLDKEVCERIDGIKAGEYVVLSISDTGCGMKPEVLARVFEPFFTTKEVGKGTGLGLATVYGIIGQNDGLIKVYSEHGIGTTFKIYLPRAEADKKTDSSPPSVALSALTGSETILLVEDEIQILNFEKILLERLGYKLLLANSPASALSIAEEYPDKIDLLITDVIMPGMNGKELQQKVMALRPHIRCIYVSGYTTGIIEHHGILPDEINFIEKPFTANLFATKIRNVLDQPG